MNKIGNQQMMRDINKSLLLHQIYAYGPISRAELARKTKLSPSTVSILIDETIREGVVYESGTSGSGVGRRMTLLSIKADSGYALGVDLGGSRCALLNMRGDIVSSETIPMLRGESEITERLPEIVAAFLESCRIDTARLRTVGVSVPGRIDATQRVVVRASPIEAENFALADVVERATGARAFLVNDLDAAGFAERFNGAAQGLDTIVYILIGYGVGAGIVIDNRVYRGSEGGAGSLPRLYPYGTRRLAGQLAQEMPRTFPAQDAPEEILQRFVALGLEQADGPAGRQLTQATEAIVEECVSIVQLLNPQQAILSGWIAENESYFELLKTKIQSRETGKLRRPTPITAAHWKLQGAAVGAATLGLHHIFRMREVD
ncbi:ROK family transcriptional regulator [Cohnella sp. LGH]|uniref:ROK family transcriptional regulator n=1 Tax=Cohnella sp. LGH TaxID=1619153 RepID=UPI001AD98CA2|nr:ROK family transcriptional regulator [Cohnella sp. LGH]QTH42445.1 ROK family transcriptional regulator [Cohnella sp. LGH]